MSALHYIHQGSSTALGNPLSDVKSLSKLYHSFTDQQWLAIKCIDTIHDWIEKVPGLLEKEVLASQVKGGGWAPRKDSVFEKRVKEALDDSAPKDSTWRYIYTHGNGLTAVIIFHLICVDWDEHFKKTRKPRPKNDRNSEDNVDDRNSKNNVDDEYSKDNVGNNNFGTHMKPESKLNPEGMFRSWEMAGKKLFFEICKNLEIPIEIANGVEYFSGNKKKRRKGLR
jgi:hypothetical protein